VSDVAPAGAATILPGGPAATGGASADPPPVVRRVRCRARCEDGAARAGSSLALDGRHLRDVVAVTFLGGPGALDDVVARPRKTSGRRVVVTVPAAARRGRLVVTDGAGAASPPTRILAIVRPMTPKAAGGPIATAVNVKRAFIDGVRRPRLTYSLATDDPAEVTVTVVQADDGAEVATFDQGTVAPGETRSVAWNGRAGDAEAPEGRYAFVVTATGPAGLRASTAQAGEVSADAFMLLAHRFPVRGRHSFGGADAAFGGGRGHEGQDVFAKCGTPLVAARGGIVKMKQRQSRAGNYLVIATSDAGLDHAYMHLRDPALVEKHERVRTGQLIGYVGDTGRANGCHLHFEAWSAPGWYTGGSPFDPLPDLRAWDAFG
jgi:murein DD-endopeptidase MepM/ murein hydrolase activator NlpD